MLLYVPTLLPGVAFGDWAEMQTAPFLLEVPHPTGFPLYVLLGRAWLLIEPFGSVAWRMNLLAAVVASLAAATAVLIAARLGARPLPALVGGMTLVAVGTVWDSATTAEVNGLHLLMVSLLLLLAIRWRDDRRDRDLLLGGLAGGLAVSNHLLALVALAVLVPAVLWAGRRTLVARPWLVPAAGLLGAAGLSLYLFIPIRVALSGPDEYPFLRTWSQIWDHVTGVAYRQDMQFLSATTAASVVRDLPPLASFAIGQAGPVVLVVALVGIVWLGWRDRWAAIMTLALLAVTVYFFVGYRGDLPHYLLVAWLVVAIWSALGIEALVRAVERRGWKPRSELALALAVPLVLALVNAPGHDRSRDTTAGQWVDRTLALLPPHAILVTYWDAGEALHYAGCVEHRRPDVDVIAPDDWVSFRPCTGLTADAALRSGRPLYALAYANRGLQALGGRYAATAVMSLPVPYGGLGLDAQATLLRLEPTG